MRKTDPDYYMIKRPGFWCAIARFFRLSFGWQKMTFDEIVDKSFYRKVNE